MEIKVEGLSEVTRQLIALPGIFKRARRSALSSIAYSFVSQEIKEFILRGGEGWPAAHPLTQLFGKKKADDHWRRRKHKGILAWLAKFVRYKVGWKFLFKQFNYVRGV